MIISIQNFQFQWYVHHYRHISQYNAVLEKPMDKVYHIVVDETTLACTVAKLANSSKTSNFFFYLGCT